MKRTAPQLHLKFNVLRQATSDALITTGNSFERKILRQLIEKGETIVGDRYYGLEYGFLDELRQSEVSFVFRIRKKPRMEILEELELTNADRAVGVTCQGLVRLGTQWKGPAVRVVKIEAGGKEILLAADLEMEAELISLIYRCRWQIELFFKWIKRILGCRHLLAESPSGVAIQIYSALIAALILQLLTGRKPGKRAMELIRFYLVGYVDLEEMTTLLGLKKTLNELILGNRGSRACRAQLARMAASRREAHRLCAFEAPNKHAPIRSMASRSQTSSSNAEHYCAEGRVSLNSACCTSRPLTTGHFDELSLCETREVA